MKDLSLHVMDIVENSIASGASVVLVSIEEDDAADRLVITIHDNGKGMTESESSNALDPFYSTKQGKRFGLGIPLLKQAAIESGGELDLISKPGTGTVIRAEFCLDHPDLKPMGDMEGTIDLLRRFHPAVTFTFERRKK